MENRVDKITMSKLLEILKHLKEGQHLTKLNQYFHSSKDFRKLFDGSEDRDIDNVIQLLTKLINEDYQMIKFAIEFCICTSHDGDWDERLFTFTKEIIETIKQKESFEYLEKCFLEKYNDLFKFIEENKPDICKYEENANNKNATESYIKLFDKLGIFLSTTDFPKIFVKTFLSLRVFIINSKGEMNAIFGRDFNIESNTFKSSNIRIKYILKCLKHKDLFKKPDIIQAIRNNNGQKTKVGENNESIERVFMKNMFSLFFVLLNESEAFSLSVNNISSRKIEEEIDKILAKIDLTDKACRICQKMLNIILKSDGNECPLIEIVNEDNKGILIGDMLSEISNFSSNKLEKDFYFEEKPNNQIDYFYVPVSNYILEEEFKFSEPEGSKRKSTLRKSTLGSLVGSVSEDLRKRPLSALRQNRSTFGGNAERTQLYTNLISNLIIYK